MTVNLGDSKLLKENPPTYFESEMTESPKIRCLQSLPVVVPKNARIGTETKPNPRPLVRAARLTLSTDNAQIYEFTHGQTHHAKNGRKTKIRWYANF